MYIRDVIPAMSSHFLLYCKANILIFIFPGLLSTLSVSMFGARIRHNPADITSYEDIHLYFGWPYIARVGSGLLTWAATVTAICNKCRSSTRTLQMEEDNIMIVSREGELCDDLMDEVANGALL